jgi:hypothetical protein
MAHHHQRHAPHHHEAAYWDFVWPRIVLGVGLAMIFVPLTNNPEAQTRLAGLKQAAMGRGIDSVTAGKTALATIYGLVRRQAAMLAYNRIFWIVGFAFLIIIPFLILLKKPQKHAPPAGVH